MIGVAVEVGMEVAGLIQCGDGHTGAMDDCVCGNGVRVVMCARVVSDSAIFKKKAVV